MAGTYTRWQWAQQFLADLGNPNPNVNTTGFVVGWTVAETAAGKGCSYNLLNTMQDAPGATNCISNGVKSYPDFKTGAQANADALKNGNYGALLHALQTNDTNNLLGPGLFGLGYITPAKNVQQDLSIWVYGRNDHDMTGYLSNINAGYNHGDETFPGTATGTGADIGNQPVGQIPGGLAGGVAQQLFQLPSVRRVGKGIFGGLLLLVGIAGGIYILLHPEAGPSPARFVRHVAKGALL